jgi:hypothetical protein
MNAMTRIAAWTGAAVLLALAGQAGAASLTKDQVKAKVEAAGYTNISDIREEKGHYDVTAMKDGKKVVIDVDANTGAISPEQEHEANEHHG